MMARLDPGLKFITLLIVSMMIAFSYRVALHMAVFVVCMLLVLVTPGIPKKRLVLGLCPFMLAAAGLFMTGYLFSNGEGATAGSWGAATMTAGSVESGLQLAGRALAFGGVGVLFALTTQPVPFVMSLEQNFHLPPKFAYGLLAAYHFLPQIKEEHAVVRASARVRGVRLSPFSPKALVPMLVRALERSESVAMAMESRGFAPGAPRAVSMPMKLRAADLVFCGVAVAATALGMVLL